MATNATPKRPKRPTYSRPTKYPAALPRTMTTTDQRADVETAASREDATLGEIIRDLVGDGLVLHAAYAHDPSLRGAVHRMASDAGVSEAEAVATMLAFAIRESRRRLERNARIAHEVGAAIGEMGFMVDGVDVGGISLNAHA